MLVLLLYFCWSAYFISSSHSSLNLNKCHDQSDGFHTTTDSDCKDYYYCSKNKLVFNESCTNNYAFDLLKQSCIPQSKALCIDMTCPATPDKFFTIPQTMCRMYYKCHGPNRYDYICPENMSFSYQLQTCVKKGLCYDPVCTGRVNGEYPDTTQECLRSFKCTGGKLVQTRHCGSNEIFSESYKQCVGSDVCRLPQETAIAFPLQQRSNNCVKLPDGMYVIPNSACKEYFVCKSKIYLGTLRCGEGLYFNGKECSEDYQCKDPGCMYLEDGVHADLYSECQDYFYCANHRMAWKHSCPSNMIHNGETCVHQVTYKCPHHQNPCLYKPDGYYRNDVKCNEYFYCSGNEMISVHHCPGDQLWNGVTCVDQGWYFCEGPKDWHGCLFKEGYFTDTSVESQCTNYYYCFNGQVTRYACPPTESFDGTKCVSKSLFKCPVSLEDSCENLTNGVYADLKRNCEAYFICFNGVKNGFKCPSNQRFNGIKCVPKNQYVCPNVQDNICSGYADGFFVYPGTGCRSYMQCQSGKLVKDFVCSEMEVFNGVNGCVAKNCTVREEFCVQDGFFQDLGSNCRSYYFCIDRRKTVLECPGDQVFNGQVCVDERFYECPENCSVYKSCVP